MYLEFALVIVALVIVVVQPPHTTAVVPLAFPLLAIVGNIPT